MADAVVDEFFEAGIARHGGIIGHAGLCDRSQRRAAAGAETETERLALLVFHLDYVSCALTVLSTVLVARRMWMGLVVAGINSALLCLIGLKTSQFGLVPANVFCIAVYAASFRSWLRPGTR